MRINSAISYTLVAILLLLQTAVTGQDHLHIGTGPYRDSLQESAASARKATLNKAIQMRFAWPDSSLYYARKVARASMEGGDTIHLIQALVLAGISEITMGAYPESIRTLQDALFYSRKLPLPGRNHYVNTVYNNLAIPYNYMGDFRTAGYYYYKLILNLRNEAAPDSVILATTYNNLGTVWINLGMYENGLYYQRMAENLARQIKKFGTLALLYANRGAWHLNQEDSVSARKYLQASLKLLEKHKEGHETDEDFVEAAQIAWLNMANLYIRQQQPEQAISSYQKALSLPRKENHRISALYGLGRANYMAGQYRVAANILTQALETAREKGLNENRVFAHFILSHVHEALGDNKTSLKHHRLYGNLKDSLYSLKTIAANHQLELQLRTEQKDREIAQKQLLIAQQKNHIHKKNLWIGGISVGALLLVSLLASLYRNKRQQASLIQMNAVLQGEENERTRLAQELHDGIGGMLAAIRMNFGTLKKQCENVLAPTHGKTISIERDFENIMEMLHETCGEVRKAAHNLMPDILIRHGLSTALRIYCEQASTTSLKITFQANGPLDVLPSSLSHSIYRIVQELVQNAIRHSDATYIVVQVNNINNIVGMIIEDNGTGFDPDHFEAGMGFKNVTSRVRIFDGDISIQSAPASGTMVHVKIDLKKIKKMLHENTSSHS